MMEHLLRLLEESGADAGPEELADILWLAERVGGTGRGPSVPGDDGPAEGVEPAPVPGGEPVFQESDALGPGDELYGPASAEGAAPGDGPARRGEPVLVRRAMALDDPLGLMRALRPFGRRTAEGGRTELDEELSVRSSIEQRMVLPVLKPVRGRWLELALVVDTHHSMLLWHDLVTELCRTITQTGIFRDVRIWYLSGTEAGGTPKVTSPTGGEPRRPREISDPSGRRLVLVLTDTVADGWSGPGVESMLRQWAAHGPTAVLNVLPRRLWNRGAGRPSGLLVRAARPAAPNATWRLGRSRTRTRGPLTGRIAVPVVEVSPAGFAALADLVAGGGRWSRMSCLLIDRVARDVASGAESVPGSDHEPLGETGPDQTVRRFQADASPVAQELAGYLSAVPLTLPIMTLVRRVMLRESEHGHLAEVALGGLFEPWRGGHREIDTDRFRFEFRPGVREALLGSQLRHEITTVQEVVRREIAAYVDRPPTGGGEFPATRVASEGSADSGPGGQLVEEGEIPFAVRPAAVREDEGIGRPLEEVTDPLEFGVHRAIEVEGVEGLPVLPAFVEREHDRELADLMALAASGGSQFVELVSNSLSGTSRSAWEAVRKLPRNWRLWAPRSVAEVKAGLARVRPRTVVWLDRLWPYEGWDDDLGAVARDWTRAPVVVLGGGQLLTRERDSAVSLVRVSDRFSSQDMAVLRTMEASDPRLVRAREEEPSGFVPRSLSGATWLIRRYLSAPATARALVNALMDARSSSQPPAMPAERLRQRTATLHIVPKEERADWFEQALGYATTPGPGTPGLVRVEGTRDLPLYAMPELAFHTLQSYREETRPERWPDIGPRLARVSTGESISTGVVMGGRRILTTAHQLRGLSGRMRASVEVTPWPTDVQSRASVSWFDEVRDLAVLQVMSPTTLSRSEEPPDLAEHLPEPGDSVQIFGFPLTLTANSHETERWSLVGRFSGMSPHAPSDMMLEVPGLSSSARTVLPTRMSGSVVLDSSGAVVGLVTSRGGAGQLWATPVAGFDPANPDGAAESRHPLLPDPARSRAVLIGAASYEDPGLSNLPEVRANLADLAYVLAPGDPDGSFDPRHVTRVQDPRTPSEVLQTIERAASEAEDVLLIYFVGHSSRDDEDLALYLSSTDPERWQSNSVSLAHLHRIAAQSRARRCVFILDCSYAGAAVTYEGRSGARQESWLLGASGRTTHARAAGPGESHTPFTEALIGALGTPTADGTGVLSFDTLFDQLRDAARHRQLPPPELHVNHYSSVANLALAVPARTPPSGPV
ncbi:SAV_2336 N-terminal domain-related protein [Streptomyces sp. NPDC057617]|uniref:caspase, EACC1-associated type n=1 Tax=Streptomyces sp. NPDC057617 TaxID=3346184 RepID=UPI0036968650